MSKQPENAQVKLGAHETDAKSAAADSVPAQPSAAENQAAGNLPASNQTAGDLPEQLGRYHIKKRLGKGAMGAVYLAHDTQLDRQVALQVPFVGAEDKFVGTDDRGEWLERFYREARAAAGFHHANLCPVYDVGQIDAIHPRGAVGPCQAEIGQLGDLAAHRAKGKKDAKIS